MRRKTGELQIFSLSFMDLLSCALGGILLLYLALLTQKRQQAQATAAALKQKEEQISKALNSLAAAQSKASSSAEKVKQLQQAQNTLVGFKGDMKNVVFVFDHSASMKSNNFPDYIVLLQGYITGLPFEKFSVVMFGDKITPLGASLESNSTSDRKKGSDFVGGFQADGRSTKTLNALETAFKFPGVDTIILMSDGAPNSPTNTVISRVKALNSGKSVTINTVAMGNYFRKPGLGPFLQQLAHDNGGEFIGR